MADAETTTGESRDERLPLRELDSLLGPARRALRWAASASVDGDALRRTARIGATWIERARGLDLPEALIERLGEIEAQLVDEDGDPRLPIGTAWQLLKGLDELLGLPLPARDRPRPPRERRKPRPERPERERGRPAERPAAAAPEPVVAPESLWDPSEGLGASLIDLELPSESVMALAAEGVETVADLLLRIPDLEDARHVYGAGRISSDAEGAVAIGGRVRARVTRIAPDGGRTHELVVVGAGPMRVRLAQDPGRWDLPALVPGSKVVLAGTLVRVETDAPTEVLEPEEADAARASEPATEAAEGAEATLEDAEPVVISSGALVCLRRYGFEGVSDRDVRAIVRWLLDGIERLGDPIPTVIRTREGLCSLAEAVTGLHAGAAIPGEATWRVAWDEALVAQLGISHRRFAGSRDRGFRHPILHGHMALLGRIGDYQLEDAQERVMDAVKRDLRGSSPMRRVILGPSGSGRGRVWLHTVAMVAESRHQSIFLAPDAATARLRHTLAKEVLGDLGVNTEVLTAPPTRTQRESLRRGEILVLFCTPELLGSGLEFRRLGLVIAEEHGEYGGAERLEGLPRAPRPDLMVIPTTMVPREILRTAYADHDISLLDGASKELEVTASAEAERGGAYEAAAARVADGGQALVLFPLSNGVDLLSPSEAAKLVATLRDAFFGRARIALLHGEQPADERFQLLDGFRRHIFDVLVSTSPIDLGSLPPRPVVAVVEQADRMALSRLLHLRGHLASGSALHLVVGSVPHTRGLPVLDMLVRGEPDVTIVETRPDLFTARGGTDDAVATRRVVEVSLETLISARNTAHELLAADPSLHRSFGGQVVGMVLDRWEGLFEEPAPFSTDEPGRRRRRRRRRR